MLTCPGCCAICNVSQVQRGAVAVTFGNLLGVDQAENIVRLDTSDQIGGLQGGAADVLISWAILLWSG